MYLCLIWQPSHRAIVSFVFRLIGHHFIGLIYHWVTVLLGRRIHLPLSHWVIVSLYACLIEPPSYRSTITLEYSSIGTPFHWATVSFGFCFVVPLSLWTNVSLDHHNIGAPFHFNTVLLSHLLIGPPSHHRLNSGCYCSLSGFIIYLYKRNILHK